MQEIPEPPYGDSWLWLVLAFVLIVATAFAAVLAFGKAGTSTEINYPHTPTERIQR